MIGTRAEIIAVGSELLTSSRIDTNSLHITERLNAIGIAVVGKGVVGDDRDQIAAAMSAALARADVVVVTGGLGPTDDDLTRDAAAVVFSLALDEDPSITERIRQRFAQRGLTMPEINRRQALVPRGARVLENPRGTAPGLWLADGGRRLLLLPGPPPEMQPMLEAWCAQWGAALSGGLHLVRRVLKVASMSESHVEELAQPAYARWRASALPVSPTILAAPGQIELHLTATAASAEDAAATLEVAASDLVQVLGESLFTTTGESLEEVTGAALRASGNTIAAAESCTGGLVLSRLTDVPGSSDYVVGGVVAYSNAVKIGALAVPKEMIDAYGAVSEPVAAAMAEGVRLKYGADVGIGVTGIAGPGGGSPDKPVGTTAIAVSSASGIVVRTYRFRGNRQMVKFWASQTALDQVRRLLRGSLA
jgi:nicotinamide-nucleotide amidase